MDGGTEVRGNYGATYTWEEKIENLLKMAKLVGTYLEVEIEVPGSDGHKEIRRKLDNEYAAFCDWRHSDPYVVDEIKQLLTGEERKQQ